MAKITPAQFKAAKPQFSAVLDETVQTYIDLAQIWASGVWPDNMVDQVQIAVVCHLMTLDGLGTDQASRDNASGRGEFQTIKTGNVTLTRFRSTAEGAGQSTGAWFAQTPCGRQFLVFVRMISSGARWVGTPTGVPTTGYAKDVYRDGWWTC